MRLSYSSFLVRGRHGRSDREFSERDRGDQRLGRKCVRVGDAAEKDQGVGVEDALRHVVHLSDARIDDRIDVTSQLDRIDLWEPSPASLQLVERHGRALQSHETSNRLATTRDRELFAALRAFDDVTTVVSEVSDRNICHSLSESRVIQPSTVRISPIGTLVITRCRRRPRRLVVEPCPW